MGRKRKNGEGTVRLRKDGRWEGRVVISYDDRGLPKTKNVLAKSKRECVEKLAGLKNALAPAVSTKVRADMPFGEWVEFWYENHSKPQLRPSTQRSYEGFIRLYILPRLFGNKWLQDTPELKKFRTVKISCVGGCFVPATAKIFIGKEVTDGTFTIVFPMSG